MQLKYGPLVSDAIGSIGGTTFQRSPIAPVARRKPLGIVRRSDYTQAIRSLAQYLSRNWRTLDPSWRDDWQSTADSLTWVNKFGDVIRGKGYWLYLRCNQYLQLLGMPLIERPETVNALDEITSASGNFSAVNTWPVEWTGTDPVGSTNYYAVFASRPMSAGRTVQHGALRYIGNIAQGTSSPVNMYPAYIARFTNPPPVGTVVFARLLPIDYRGGYQGVPADFIAGT